MIHILFVCLGNICRSPMAECIMRAHIEQARLTDSIQVDSCGTSDYQVGKPPDRRMQQQAAKRGYQLTGQARQFNPNLDFQQFDYIITMDDENFDIINDHDTDNKNHTKIYKLVQFSEKIRTHEVPDPYHGGDPIFSQVIDILEDACKNLLNHIRSENNQDDPDFYNH